jgi:hypothetical protein
MASISGTTMAIMAVMAAAAAASTTMSIQAANNQAEAQVDASNKAAAADYTSQTTQQDQVNQQAAQEKMQRAQQAMAERAKLRVTAGESGVGGLSPMKDIAETYMNQGLDASTLETNRANKVRQIQNEKDSTSATAQGRRSVAMAGMSSGWTAGLQIGTAALSGSASGYSTGKSLEKK